MQEKLEKSLFLIMSALKIQYRFDCRPIKNSFVLFLILIPTLAKFGLSHVF